MNANKPPAPLVTPVLLALVVLSLGGGCATTTTLSTAVPHQSVILDDHDLGSIPAAGLIVEVDPGAEPVPWQLMQGDAVVAEGTLARSEAQWPVVVGAVTAAACCVPSAAAAGFCLANPAIIAGLLTCLVVGPGGLIAILQAPSWFTVPLSCAGSAVGTTPLLLGLVGAAPPAAVELERPPTLPTVPTNAPTAPLASMLDDAGRRDTVLAEVPW